MTTKKNSVPARLDSIFNSDLEESLNIRMKNGLIKNRREMTMPEITSLARKTNSWKGVLLELRTKPKRENLI